MTFLVRQIEKKDIEDIYELTEQFTLLNLPHDRGVITRMVEKSIRSFQGDLAKEEGLFIFCVEDLEKKKVVATSLIIAKHGTEDVPHLSFKLIKSERFSKDIGVGFIHQVLRFTEDKDGPSEIGGLLLHRDYRNRPEKIGRWISLIRFLYMGIYPERFQPRVLCELSPPLTSDGRSEFWEALGRRFTGLPYTEADQISQSNKEFIQSLFPSEDIYLCLLDAKARVDIGRVAESTEPAKHMLTKIGFKYLEEVDPFDGGPHYGANLKDIKVVQEMKEYRLSSECVGSYEKTALLASDTDKGFRGAFVNYNLCNNEISLPAWVKEKLGIENSSKVYIYDIKG